ncbi:DUF1467 family protein [Acetobacteraceae bacterium H6797]|nr:DUF1467 family protein [Acetobacteraceae bacterium H6797]
MSWFTGFVTFALVWWLTLFAILPLGTRPGTEADPETGGWRGTPQRPDLGRKILITTLVAAVISAGVIALIHSDWLSFRSGWLAMPEK